MTRTHSYAIASMLFALAGVCLHILINDFHGWAACPLWWKCFMSVPVWAPGLLAFFVMCDCWKRNGMYKGEFYLIVLACVVGIAYVTR